MHNKLFSISTPHLSLVLCLLFFLSACDARPPASENKTKAPVRPAKLIEISQANEVNFLKYPAVISSQKLSSLSFEVGGVLKELLVVQAQKVVQGEVLARLDQRDLQAALSSARAQFDSAATEYQRALRLIKEDAIARSVLEQRLAQHDIHKAQLDTAKKALEDSVLLAPYAGNIARVLISEQQAVQAGSPAISILGDGGLEATINLPASILARAGRKKTGEALAYLVLDAAPNHRIPAKFTEISLEADAASQTYELTFTFEAPEGLNILPGMNATVWFKEPGNLSAKHAQPSVPLTAIGNDGEQKYVWVVDKETMIITRRNITLEAGVGVNLNVSSGLDAGDIIVGAGISSLSEGMHVRPWSQ